MGMGVHPVVCLLGVKVTSQVSPLCSLFLFPDSPALPEFSCTSVCFNPLQSPPLCATAGWCLMWLLQLLARSPACFIWKFPPREASWWEGKEKACRQTGRKKIFQVFLGSEAHLQGR